MKPKFSDGEHYEAYIKSPRVVAQIGKYICETLHKVSEFPRGTVFRTKVQAGHKIIVGYWGKGQFAVSSVLHPKGEKACRFQARLAKMGVKLTPGKAIHLNGVKRLTGDRKTLIINPLRFFTR